jgi:hypothetical protein
MFRSYMNHPQGVRSRILVLFGFSVLLKCNLYKLKKLAVSLFLMKPHAMKDC